MVLRLAAAELAGHAGHGSGVRRRPDEEHDRPARADERQAPLGRDRRRGERLRDGHPGPVRLLLLGAAADDAGVRRRPLLEEHALAPLRLEQDELAGRGSASASGIPGAPPPEPTSTIGSPNRASSGSARSESSSEHPARFRRVAERRQPGRLDDGAEPVSQCTAGETTT